MNDTTNERPTPWVDLMEALSTLTKQGQIQWHTEGAEQETVGYIHLGIRVERYGDGEVWDHKSKPLVTLHEFKHTGLLREIQARQIRDRNERQSAVRLDEALDYALKMVAVLADADPSLGRITDGIVRRELNMLVDKLRHQLAEPAPELPDETKATPRFQFGRKPMERRHDIERERLADIPRHAQEPADKLAAELLWLCERANVGSCAFTPDELLAEVVRIVSRTFRDGCTYDEMRLGLPPASSSRTVPHLRRSNI